MEKALECVSIDYHGYDYIIKHMVTHTRKLQASHH